MASSNRMLSSLLIRRAVTATSTTTTKNIAAAAAACSNNVPLVTKNYYSTTIASSWVVKINKNTQQTSFFSTSASDEEVEDDIPLSTLATQPDEDVTKMTKEQLQDNTTIPGWNLIHSPPRHKRDAPRGALVGTVVSDKMQKTVNVAVDRYRIVPKYGKRMRYTRKFMAHDEEELCGMGDLVMIVPCQQISKRKHFMVREIIRAKGQL